MALHHTDKKQCELCESKLKLAHPYLVDWFHKKKDKYKNLHVSWAFRNETEQNAFYRDGKTRAMWPNSPHNKTPAEALDLFLIDEDGVARFPVKFYVQLDQENQADKEPIYWGGNIKLAGQGSRPDFNHYQLIVAKLPANAAPKVA